MTERDERPADVEVPEADAIEQRTDAVPSPDDDPGRHRPSRTRSRRTRRTAPSSPRVVDIEDDEYR